MRGLSAIGGFIAGKTGQFLAWSIAGLGGGALLEKFTSKGDGKGGTLTGAGREGAEVVVGETSGLGGLNAALDAQLGAMAGWSGAIGGGLASIFDLIASFCTKMGWTGAAQWSKDWGDWSRGFKTEQDEKMRAIRDDFRKNIDDGGLGSLTVPGLVTAGGVIAGTAMALKSGKSTPPAGGGTTPGFFGKIRNFFSPNAATIIDPKDARSVMQAAQTGVDDVAVAAAKSSPGLLRSAFGAVAKRLGVVGLVAAPVLAATTATASPTEAAADSVGLDETYDNIQEGDYKGAVKAATAEGANLVTTGVTIVPMALGGIKLGAAAGGALGAAFFGVGAVPGAVIGGAIGGVAGVATSLGVGEAAEWGVNKVWDGGEYVWSKGADAFNYIWGEDEVSNEFGAAAADSPENRARDAQLRGDNDNAKYVANNANNRPVLESLAIGAP
jgi:hypothetical protein